MIRLADNLWIGDSGDEGYADLEALGVRAVLNVAHDLQGTRGCLFGIEYMQVGLIDGPGNPSSAYYAAVMALVTLLRRGKVMVCCHTGGRSLAVALLYLNLTARRGWDGWLELLSERVDAELPIPHEAHKTAFNKINWRLLTAAMED